MRHREYRFLVMLLVMASLLSVCVMRPRATSAAVEACRVKYDRVALFGNSPTSSARREAIAIAAGVDFYTGAKIVGPVEVDHVYPLAAAAPYACLWTTDRRRRFANDQLELVATSRTLNRAKSDFTPSRWSPALRSRSCLYGRRFQLIAKTYDLPVMPADAKAITAACGS